MSSNLALGRPGGKSYENDAPDGDTSSSGYERTSWNMESGNTIEVSMHTQHDDEGKAESHSVIVTVRDKDDEVIGSTNITNNSDGTKTETVTNADGSRVVKTFDKDGKLVSTENFPATEGDETETPEEDNTEFWDADLIYGDHSDPFQSPDMASDMKMLLDMDPSLEMYVDHFDFV